MDGGGRDPDMELSRWENQCAGGQKTWGPRKSQNRTSNFFFISGNCVKSLESLQATVDSWPKTLRCPNDFYYLHPSHHCMITCPPMDFRERHSFKYLSFLSTLLPSSKTLPSKSLESLGLHLSPGYDTGFLKLSDMCRFALFKNNLFCATHFFGEGGMMCGIQDLSPQIRDQTHAPCSGSSLHHWTAIESLYRSFLF